MASDALAEPILATATAAERKWKPVPLAKLATHAPVRMTDPLKPRKPGKSRRRAPRALNTKALKLRFPREPMGFSGQFARRC